VLIYGQPDVAILDVHQLQPTSSPILRRVAGVHFTEDDISFFGLNKKVNGRALWAMGLSVLRSIKKALAIVPKLSPRIVMIDKSCAVIGYTSEQNEQSFMQLIDNGLFNMDETIIVDGIDGSDDDDEVLGSVSEMGMPITREDTVGDIKAEDNQIVPKEWDPFQRGTVIAPEGFTYLGKLSFICFGPTSKFFAATLAMGGQSNRTVAERKEGSRKAFWHGLLDNDGYCLRRTDNNYSLYNGFINLIN
jgi:hypothetical protein